MDENNKIKQNRVEPNRLCSKKHYKVFDEDLNENKQWKNDFNRWKRIINDRK